jgi:5'-phosphate synthase pdxT subunit
MRIGVLALQGAFGKHLQMVKSLGVEAVEVRNAKDLERCDALIIPGGESTTIRHLLKEEKLMEKLAAFGQEHPVFGTCAGLILMAKEIVPKGKDTQLGWLDITVERNAFGRQVESFQTNIELKLGKPDSFPALFIRAPRIRTCSPQVEILATLENEPVLVRQGHFLGATFHPELTNNSSIHLFFINTIK